MSNLPELFSQRLILNELNTDDIDDLFEMLSDPLVVQHHNINLYTHKTQAADFINTDKQRIQNNELLRWAVREKQTGQFIGSIGVGGWDNDAGHAIIGYEFNRASWGQGYATEVLAAILGYLFSDACPHSINRLQAYTLPGNEASDRVLQKSGFVEEGLLRQHGFWKGKHHDLKLFAHLRSDSRPQN